MPPKPLSGVRRTLRDPWAITAELGLIVAGGLVTALVEQHPTPRVSSRLGLEHPLWAAVVRALGLDRVLSTPWFLAMVALASGSLAVVVWEQWSRLRREWAPPDERVFRSAPYRREGTRPSRGAPGVRVASHGRLGSLGSPLFHAGLLVVALSGIGRMLLAAEAAGDVVEQAPLGPGPGAFQLEDRGLLAAPVALPDQVRLASLDPVHYPSGALLGLSARLSLGAGSGAPAELAVNAPLRLPGGLQLYLTQSYGPAAVLDLGDGQGARLALLAPGDGSDYEWSGPLPSGVELRLRAPDRPEARPPQEVDVRVLDGPTVLAAGRLAPGGRLVLPGGGQIELREVRWWAKLLASRDPSVWPVFTGFAVAILGVVLMATVNRVDVLVRIEAAGVEERVVVAARPRRLAPLYAERFERLARRELG